jgi:hypothetical protein
VQAVAHLERAAAIDPQNPDIVADLNDIRAMANRSQP